MPSPSDAAAVRTDLPSLYRRMRDITRPLCLGGYRDCARLQSAPYRCCSPNYCELARRFAQEKYNITLRSTGHAELPFMGTDGSGCSVEPYLRPLCTLHICCYSYAPVTFSLPGYDELRDEILAEAIRQDKWPL